MYSFEEVSGFDPEVAKAMTDEINRQNENIELIASENIVSKAEGQNRDSHDIPELQPLSTEDGA